MFGSSLLCDGVDDGLATGEEFVEQGEDFGLDVGPRGGAVFGDGDVVEPEEDGGYTVDVEELGGERGGEGGCEGSARVEVLEERRGDELWEDTLVGVEFERLRESAGFEVEVVSDRSRRERTSALGVGSVWMNIVRRTTVAGAGDELAHGCALGLCCDCVVVRAEDCWCKHLVAMRGACDERTGSIARQSDAEGALRQI